MSENKYIQFQNTAYIFLSDGSVARLLKPTFIHKQVYFNLILDGKMRRMNRLDVIKAFTPSNG